LVLASLQELAMAYLRRDGAAIPFWRMATLSLESLETRARALGVGDVTELDAVPGGGTLPGVTIPSMGVALDGDHSASLREGRGERPPIIARVAEGRTLIDLRTVDPADDPLVADVLRSL
jgi:L-seryl-tRNA(Ser) seleniumtransferase